jgi:hypothetical protein
VEIQLIERMPTGWQISIMRFNSAGLTGDHERVKSTHCGLLWVAAIRHQLINRSFVDFGSLDDVRRSPAFQPSVARRYSVSS